MRVDVTPPAIPAARWRQLWYILGGLELELDDRLLFETDVARTRFVELEESDETFIDAGAKVRLGVAGAILKPEFIVKISILVFLLLDSKKLPNEK